ncbi:MAG: arginine N-succinyltransferase [Abyssibacter sp.]|uniref:arginine N-succinyltransferase n=1 Tax=Abyssibacter sp. TaxID=2320200 RepID=UPI00321B3F40
MMVLRAMRNDAHDFEALCRIAELSGPGFTSLTTDRDLLQHKISRSEEAFTLTLDAPLDELYLFSLEDSRSAAVGGCCGLESAVGMREPFYNYRVGTVVHASRELGVYRKTPTLYLSNDYTGCSELCTLFLNPDFRGGGNGTLLSKSRFLFMAEHPERFNDRVLAEMRGWSDEHGHSPFWEALGRKFFDMEYARADHLTAVSTKAFIAELMPRYPVYTTLLPEEAQRVIGMVHPNTEPALRMLKAEGFRYQGYVDIFDGGAAVDVLFEDIKAIKRSRVAESRTGRVDNGVRVLVSNRGLADFRCTLTQAQITEDGALITIPQEAADALQLDPRASLRYLPLG